jgi:hypothetical protein
MNNFSEHLDKKELLTIEKQVRDKGLIYRHDVQNLLRQASLSRNPRIYESIVNRLRLILESHNENAMRLADPYIPYCPVSLSNSGELYILTQMDGVKISIDPDTLVTGMLVIGPTGSGKSIFIVHLCEELLRVRQ